MKVLIPNTIDVAVPGDLADVVVYDVARPLHEGHLDADVLVVWHNAEHHLRDAARRLPKVRLVQTLAAGPDATLNAGFPPSTVIASGRSLHDGTVAEHALTLVLGAVRRLDRLRDAQSNAHWDNDFAKDQEDPATEGLYTLDGSHVLIWGFGSIGRTLAPLLAALGAHVTGVATTAGQRGGFTVIAHTCIRDVLPDTDVLVSLLPATGSTERAFNAELIELMKPTAAFINVGRGATVDTAALVAALTSGRLRVAALDVFDEEPVPNASALWTTPNLIMTPHVAGNRPRGATALIAHNIRALAESGQIKNRCN